MKTLLSLLVLVAASFALAQTHDLKPAEAMQNIAFLKGDWVGKQNFNVPDGPPMSGDATNRIEDAIGGRYLCEMLSTTLPGRKPTDTRHFITFDAKAGVYKAWWFTDTSVGPLEWEGTVAGTKLVLNSKPTGSGATMRATYEVADGKLTYTLEMKQGENWQRLFTTVYTKKA